MGTLPKIIMSYQNINDVELRKLPSGSLFQLFKMLELGEGWKELMSVIREECKEENPLKYTHEHITMIESAGKCQQRPFSEILFEEWSSSGKNRPTVSYLRDCLLQANLYRAAVLVSTELLKEPPPPRPKSGPAAAVNISLPEKTVTDLEPSAPPPSSICGPSAPTASSDTQPTELLNTNNDLEDVVSLPFALLEQVTGRFSEDNLLGAGGGGSVYAAHLPRLGPLAVKKLHNQESLQGLQLQFRNEVKVLAKLSHPNLLPLLGYSDDSPTLCIVYKFMMNGSLLDRLARKGINTSLPWRLRVRIAMGTAQSLDYLHSLTPKALVHRDVKSANILLDDNFIPKLGDFALACQDSSTRTLALSKNDAAGTCAYMPPEGFRGDVSVKLDVYSFGVVMLELLTSLPPYDTSRDGHDLVTYMDGVSEPESLIDKSAGEWPDEVSSNMFELANLCLRQKKKDRPFIAEIIPKLEACLV